MAEENGGKPYKYTSRREIYLLSTEDKPTNDLAKGSLCFEIDTTRLFMWDGKMWWEI